MSSGTAGSAAAAANTLLATHPTKCPCCNNPWSAATGDFFAQMCAVCETTSSKGFGIDRANLDESVNKTQNFFLWANGTWMKQNPIPSGYPSWNTFMSLHVQSQERCKALLEQVEGEDTSSSSIDLDKAKLGMFYQAAMDESTIEALGVHTPLQAVMDFVETIVGTYESNDLTKYAVLLGQLASKYGIAAFCGTGASPDMQDSDHTICQIGQGGLGLPDRDYYFDEDKQDIRDKYVQHVARMLSLYHTNGGASDDDMTEPAHALLELEKQLAEAHLTRTENRDPETTYNKMSIADLTNNVGQGRLDYASYLVGTTGHDDVVTRLGEVNVRQVQALAKVAEMASTVAPSTLRVYLQYHVLKSLAPYLNAVMVQEHFDFFERTLSGTQEMKPRWKRAMAFVEEALGEALGKIYCRTYFDESCKARALKIVEQVRQALEERLKEVDWIKSESTRDEALKKMSKFEVMIGYPNKWIDYADLVLDPSDTFVDMVLKARAFHHRREVKEMNAPTDREKWFMTPQTVNAYYHPSLNCIVFPAAILQHPFFDKNADDAVNFGAMGAVVGHEMTHGFDDKGRKFNYAGILHDWWTEQDAKEYESRVEVMVEQANQFQVEGKSVQGKLTSGENIADLGGLRLSLRALRATPGFDDSQMMDGFSPTQRFFLSWAQCWRQNITKERSLQLLTLDPHGPNEMRCNGPLSNIADFHAAFDIPAGCPMYKPSGERVDIW